MLGVLEASFEGFAAQTQVQQERERAYLGVLTQTTTVANLQEHIMDLIQPNSYG